MVPCGMSPLGNIERTEQNPSDRLLDWHGLKEPDDLPGRRKALFPWQWSSVLRYRS